MHRRALLFASLLLAVPAAFAAEPEDAEGVKDHPDVPRFPGFVITEGTANDFNSHEFPVGPDKTVSKEGRYWTISYGLKEGAKQPSALEVVRNYEAAFKKHGGKLVYRQIDDNGGVVTYSMPLGKSERWLSIDIYNGSTNFTFNIIEVAAMAQKVEVSASEMLDALNKNGFIALYGITFDTGKDTIKPESEPLLAEIATLLTQNADLKLSVEGHTDNVGNAKANEALSKKRAEKVKAWLAGKGVAAARLSTNGFGDKKPVADNRSEDGRAKNRRVELVKK